MTRRPFNPARTAALVFLASIVVANCSGGGGACNAQGCAQGCSSGGCGGAGCGGAGCTIEPIPGGFPRAEEIPAGVQVRVTKGGLGFMEKNADALVKQLLPTGLNFDVPPSCDMNVALGMTINICGQKQGNACVATTPPCHVSAALKGVTITPNAQTQDTVRISTRISASTPLGAPLRTSGLLNCTIDLDTMWAGKPDAGFAVDVHFKVDPTTKRTTVAVENATMTDLDNGDVKIGGGILCKTMDFGLIKGFVLKMVKNQISDMVSGMVDDQLCARCDLGPCPSGSTCDPKTKRCLVGKTCVQSLGLEGRVPLTMIPGAEGKLDFITWLGGLVQMPAGGVTLGMIGGSAPNQVSTCIKPRPDLKPKTSPPVPVATLLRGDVDAKGQPYDLGIAVHQRLFDQGAWSAYTAGGLCIDVDSSLSDMLSTGTFSLIMPSINILTGGETSPMRLTLVPSAPPTLTIGKGIVEKDAKGKYTIKEPLLTIALKDLDIHMFAMVAERFVQVLNLKADVNIPIALQIANGEVVPVIGNLENALTNLRISGSELLAETPKSLETKFPIVLKLALGMLPDLVNQTFPLPAMMGLEIKDPTFVGIENNTMVGIFAQIALAPQKTSAEVPLPFPEAPAQTDAKVIEVLMPRDPEVMRLRRHDDLHHGPIARVAVGGPNDGRDLEYSWRLDHTTWSRFSRGSILEIQSSLLFLLGRHDLEIRARVAGLPNTTDPTPRRLTVTIKSPFDSPPSPASATDAPDDALGGCAIGRRSKGSSGLTGIFFSLLGLFALQRRRRRRQQQQRRHDGTRFIAALVVTTMVFATAACGGDTPATGDFGVSDASDLSPGENAIPTLKPGMVGRHSALAASTDTLYASAYEQTYGDLVFITAPVANLTQLTYEVVDGAPKAPVIHDPKGYRGGVERDGDDVGLGTDLTLDTAGAPIISYHDLTHHTLRFAQRSAEGWTSHEVAAPTAESQEIVGRYTAVTIVGGKPAIAFFVQNISKSAGTFGSELRWALAQTTSPKSATDWTISVIDAGFSPCQDLCAKDEGCFVTTTGSACKKVATGCATCAAKTACLAGKCEPVLEPSKLTDIPKALGIWPTLVATTSGTVFAVYHDALAGTLKVARLASASATTWTKKVVASSKSGEIVGAYPDATATATELQIAYQNATRGTLHHLDLELTTLASKGTSTIDDGLRPDGRHRVGADPAILVDSVGTARVAYQDQQTSDLLVVTRSAPGAWTPKKAGDANLGRLLKGGDKGYGFYTGLVLVGASVYGSSFVLEANGKPPGILEFFKLP